MGQIRLPEGIAFDYKYDSISVHREIIGTLRLKTLTFNVDEIDYVKINFTSNAESQRILIKYEPDECWNSMQDLIDSDETYTKGKERVLSDAFSRGGYVKDCMCAIKEFKSKDTGVESKKFVANIIFIVVPEIVVDDDIMNKITNSISALSI